jgi:hypothetical protein
MLPSLATLVLAIAAPDRVAWAGFGHRALARVAAELLTPEARRAVRELLRDSSLASVAVWADEIRARQPETVGWHFVNIPLEAAGYDPAAHCPAHDCVIEAIRFNRAVLADPSAPRGSRLQALKYLVHFVGDLHQPLHVSDNRDRGGNDVLVTVPGRGSARLHSVWDAVLFEAGDWTEERLTVELRARANANRAAWEGGDLPEWVEEARRLARDHAYRLPAPDAVDQRYLTEGLEVAIVQLARGAVRLAELLNLALAGKA